ncbi:Phenazine biosynthesis protein PhzF like [uncultured Gammaproteobacteria bacterium]|jgi:PhzF family phenazine biosynthesis protein|nr:Phenazine biosynthesis protein PhzF like [uncultured Gammaproteobacteria bacterium]CAC9547087.1 Phenazine biosynthesis protein PhzF like [uncultured Gammaproteobacteria bacterium]CAC9556550.1 Phenazine biosynthesis protein PhzF like [uncultured Gammaproteobacteria bacterium]CAC9561199.1 Phenazine biosynthesis protein PhzF like [uncultured Gammaproteobacteria bacterium]CAC9563585.1 Phenazine biosynthesis protein PhzF like [uncultured Gammaproteobacteria bacterium]
MTLTLYQIDAFASKLFEGNPAAICPLDKWLPDELMQSIASENNLSETAFFVPIDSTYQIRWFTPACEVDLCGHATLAAAFVLFNILKYQQDEIQFSSKSGILTVVKNQNWLEMDFPAQLPIPCSTPKQILEAFSITPIACFKSEDYVVVFEDEQSILAAKPDLSLLSQLDLRGVIITARGSDFDFVIRFFAPKYGINEDPVTGSAFTQATPYWSKRLKKNNLVAKQLSKRGGEIRCQLLGQRVKISGKAIKYMTGTITIVVPT